MTKSATTSKGVLHRELARAGLWVSSGQPIAAPFTAPGLSNITVASGQLKVTPDMDILAWLCAKWLSDKPADGVLRPRFYEIAKDLYGGQSGHAYELIDDALERMGETTVKFTFYDKPYSADAFEAGGSIIHYVKPKWKRGGEFQIAEISLNLGIRQGIEKNQAVLLDWRIMREFHGRQQLAKRLWCYLQAEKWTRANDGFETTWMGLGERFYTALGIAHVDGRTARRKIAVACKAIRNVDPRYLVNGAYLELDSTGDTRLLRAKRPNAQTWKKVETQVKLHRAAVKEALAKK